MLSGKSTISGPCSVAMLVYWRVVQKEEAPYHLQLVGKSGQYISVNYAKCGFSGLKFSVAWHSKDAPIIFQWKLEHLSFLESFLFPMSELTFSAFANTRDTARCFAL